MTQGGSYEQFNIVLNLSNTFGIRRDFRQQSKEVKNRTPDQLRNGVHQVNKD